MTENKIEQEVFANIEEKGGKKYIDCESAFEIAKKHGVKVAEVAKIINRNKIKIKSCQLGCF